MEKESSMLVSEWWETLTISGLSNILLLIAFVVVIIVMVARTFKNKPSA